MLDPKGKELIPILVLLIFHYIADAVILLHNWWIRKNERAQDRAIEITLLKIMAWLINNLVFAGIFMTLLVIIIFNDDNKEQLVILFGCAWLMNSVIAVGIAMGFGRQRRKQGEQGGLFNSKPAVPAN